ncbi:hypothetical protein QJS10_CPB17g01322 [Acorus calamus]|uniref:Mitochondrial pyruvate carrier n=1 Tax=Acorus calamus TaxID=4465 RepID=A0AAV9CUV1_ACOCL|nr:hypothetical protein QJS10_CPB17g01322 [Acorus calamus]
MGSAMGMDVSFSDVQGLWEAGKKMRRRGDRSVSAKFTFSFIPAVTWAIWLTRNQALFRGVSPYVENTWNTVIHSVKDWGVHCAGAPRVGYVNERFVLD